jgi:anti-sigma B factor antagonist
MQINKIIDHGVAVLTLTGNFLCEPDKFRVKEHIAGLLAEGMRKAVVDLTEVKCVNSEGLGTLIMALTSFRKAGGDLRLAHVSEMVYTTLTITQLIKVFRIYKTVDDAVLSYQHEMQALLNM